MEWLGVIERFIDRWEIVMSVVISAGVVLLFPLLFPQLDSWKMIWSPYPGGWWIFIAFIFSSSLMCCKIVKSLPTCIFYIREARENKKKISQYEAEIFDLRRENRALQSKIKPIERSIAGKM
jgi:hypothetical protein